jgi:hypothetical protein
MSYEDKIKEQARPYLQPGERVLAAVIARPRGATQVNVGGLGGSIVGAGRSPSRIVPPKMPGSSWLIRWR